MPRLGLMGFCEIKRVFVSGGSLSLTEANAIQRPGHDLTRIASDLVAILADGGFAEVACIDDGRGWLIVTARQPT